jgi:hypothetical protein
VRTIRSTNGFDITVDDRHYDLLSTFKWRVITTLAKHKYALICLSESGKRKAIYMHRIVGQCPRGLCIDHINHNTLDNRESNLRIVTMSQNLMNARQLPRGLSGCVGVVWNKRSGKWLAQIRVNYQNKKLGLFRNCEDAIQVRREAERKYFGEYACKMA